MANLEPTPESLSGFPTLKPAYIIKVRPCLLLRNIDLLINIAQLVVGEGTPVGELPNAKTPQTCSANCPACLPSAGRPADTVPGEIHSGSTFIHYVRVDRLGRRPKTARGELTLAPLGQPRRQYYYSTWFRRTSAQRRNYFRWGLALL